jgi:hypothetical protein
MATHATIELEVSWVRVEPDGSECVCCGDICYLWMWTLIVTASKFVNINDTEIVLCDSCHQLVDK